MSSSCNLLIFYQIWHVIMTKDALDLARSAKRFFSGTMISRISGLGRDMSMAYVFGSQPIVAAFMIAFRFSNVLRRLFGEGALQSTFVPHFEDVKAEAPARAASFYRDLSIALTFILLIIISLTELGLWAWLKFGSPSADNVQVIELTAIMFPGILFICLYGLNSALLQCQGSFFTPSVAPVAFNCIWIAAVFILKRFVLQEAIPLLAMAVVVAYLFQWMMTVPLSYLYVISHLPRKFWKGVQVRSNDLRRLGKPLFLGIVGVSAAQINNALDPLFARAADLEGPAYLWYAYVCNNFPWRCLGSRSQQLCCPLCLEQ
jgi:putative peptidoglycan lipid II flippase